MNEDTKAIIELHRRLDEWQHLASMTSSDPDTSLVSVVRVLGRLTNGYFSGEFGSALKISAHEADDIVKNSSILSKLLQDYPSLGVYSLDILQLWTGSKLPSPALFDSKHMLLYQAKPFGLGIYTSSMLRPPAISMWKLYLENYGGNLFTEPWTPYELTVKPEARVYDVTSAERWVNLVKEYPLHKDSLIYPDWYAIARDYDGIHMSLPAVIAIQGFRLKTEDAEIAESYWDVETSLWFSWVFDDVQETKEVS